MALKRDYYQILGIRRGATEEEIKRAYRRLAFRYHPDHNKNLGAEERFKEINEAFEVLSDSQRRAAYDRSTTLGNQGLGRNFEGFDLGGLGDVFEAFFGRANRRNRARVKGSDLRYNLSLSFEEAAFGCEKVLEIERTEICPACHGTGNEPGNEPIKCPNCDGTGEVRHYLSSFFGPFTNVTSCEYCGGEGYIVAQPCQRCQGTGRERVTRRVVVKVPAGVDHGGIIRLSGEGNHGLHGGSPGDLCISLSVKEHEFFKRDGHDILYELPLNFAQAALGGEVDVPTLNGHLTLRIPPGVQTGRIFRLKGKGVPRLHKDGRGDQLVKVRVVTPIRLNERQKELLQELAQSLSSDSSTWRPKSPSKKAGSPGRD